MELIDSNDLRITYYESDEDWKADRKGCGATTAYKLLEMCPASWGGPWSVWASHHYDGWEDTKSTAVMSAGLTWEPYVLQWYDRTRIDGDDDSDSDDGRMKSPQALVRGKATISIISPIQPSIAGREVSLRSPGGGGNGNSKKKSSADKAAAAKKKALQQKKKKREERIELSDSDDSDDVMDLISSDESSEDDEPIAKKARPARRSSAAATKTYKEDSDSDEDGDGDDDDEEEESDFDDDDDDDSDFE